MNSAKSVWESVKNEYLSSGGEIDNNGIIKSLGRFQGEHESILYWYECSMLGGGEVFIEVSNEEKKLFDIDYDYIILYVNNDGFVKVFKCKDESEVENLYNELYPEIDY